MSKFELKRELQKPRWRTLVLLAVAGTLIALNRLLTPGTAVSRSIVAQRAREPEAWWRELVASDSSFCKHTFNFFHFFMPHVACKSPTRLGGGCQDGAKVVCGVEHIVAKPSCVVYSFGSSDNSCFESSVVATMPNCEVHIFDPTSSELKHPRWTYHAQGLGGADPSDTRFWDWRTQKPATCDGCAMRTLKQFMSQLGHSHIDILKVDVDGAEWRSFEAIFDDFPGVLPFDQLQIETTGLDISPGNFPRVENFFSTLFVRGFAAFNLETNPGTCEYRPKDQGTSVEYSFLNLMSSTHSSLLSAGPGRPRPVIYTDQHGQ